MKKYLPCIAGVLLGLCFLMASIPVLFNLIKIPQLPEGTPACAFHGGVRGRRVTSSS